MRAVLKIPVSCSKFWYVRQSLCVVWSNSGQAHFRFWWDAAAEFARPLSSVGTAKYWNAVGVTGGWQSIFAHGTQGFAADETKPPPLQPKFSIHNAINMFYETIIASLCR